MKFTDSQGYWFFFDGLIAGIVGLFVGIIGQFMADIVTSFSTGTWRFSSWETYLGSGIGGVVGGIASLYITPIGGITLGAGIGTLVGESLESFTGTNIRSFEEILISSIFSASIAVLTGGLNKYFKIPGITSGSHSFTQIWKSGITKSMKYGSKMSKKVVAKGFIATMVKEFSLGWFSNSSLTGILQAIREIFSK